MSSVITKAALGLFAGKDLISALSSKDKKKVVKAAANQLVRQQQPMRSKPQKKQSANKTSQIVTAPSNSGMRTMSLSGAEHMTRLEVDTIGVVLKVLNSSAGGDQPISFSDGLYATTAGLDFKPKSFAGSPAAFGAIAGQMQTCFARFRLKKLVVTFVPTLPTSTAGIVSFSAGADPYDVAPSSLLSLTSSAYNITAPIWCPNTVLDLTPIVNDGDWKYCSQQNNNVGDLRLGAPGSIQGYVSGVPSGTLTAGDTIGYLKVRAVIEFKSPIRSDLLGEQKTPDSHSKDSEQYDPYRLRLEAISRSASVAPGGSSVDNQASALNEMRELRALLARHLESVREDPVIVQKPPNTN